MLCGLLFRRPTGAVQVAIHHQLSEREEAEIDFIILHFPVLQSTYGLTHCLKVGLGIQILEFRKRRQLSGKILLQLKCQRQVFLNMIPRVGQLVPLTHRSPLKFDRHQQQRRFQLALGILRIAPVQHAQGEIKHIHTALLNVSACRAFGVQQAPLQPAVGIVRLQARVAQFLLAQWLEPFLAQGSARRGILHPFQMFPGQNLHLAFEGIGQHSHLRRRQRFFQNLPPAVDTVAHHLGLMNGQLHLVEEQSAGCLVIRRHSPVNGFLHPRRQAHHRMEHLTQAVANLLQMRRQLRVGQSITRRPLGQILNSSTGIGLVRGQIHLQPLAGNESHLLFLAYQ